MNVSEGRDEARLGRIAQAAADDLLDLHHDPDHHRAVASLVGTEAPRRVAAWAVQALDLTDHDGVHPRLGVVDVVPFVALDDQPAEDARRARDDFARWAATELGVPCFLYGPVDGGTRTLPEIRRHAFAGLAPDRGPDRPHPTAGAMAVGARPVLVAYNLWLAGPDLERARAIAAEIRRPEVRALGLAVGREVQVSLNLLVPERFGPAQAYDFVAERAPLARAELVGLTPRAVLDAAPESRWAQLDLAPGKTIEARLDERRARSKRARR